MWNHYHLLGFLKKGETLGRLMQRVHGSVAKLVNDILPERRVPFWREAGRQDYFDGCIRNVRQCRRAWGYTQRQAVRHGIVGDYRLYPQTRIYLPLEPAIERAIELKGFMEGVRYKRYDG